MALVLGGAGLEPSPEWAVQSRLLFLGRFIRVRERKSSVAKRVGESSFKNTKKDLFITGLLRALNVLMHINSV